MSQHETRNPVENTQHNADQNAKAPLQDRPVSHPDPESAQDRPKTLRKTDADA